MVCLSWLDMEYPLHDCFDSLTVDVSAFRNPGIGRPLPFVRVEILLNSVDEAFDCYLSFWSLEAVFRPPETLRPLRGQPVAVLVQVHQREGRAQPLVILLQAAIAHLGKSEDALQNPERMLQLGPDFGLGREHAKLWGGVGCWDEMDIEAGC